MLEAILTSGVSAPDLYLLYCGVATFFLDSTHCLTPKETGCRLPLLITCCCHPPDLWVVVYGSTILGGYLVRMGCIAPFRAEHCAPWAVLV